MATCKNEEIPYTHSYWEKSLSISLSIVLLLFHRHSLTEHNLF